MGCQNSKVFVLEELSKSKGLAIHKNSKQPSISSDGKQEAEILVSSRIQLKREVSLPKLLPSMENLGFEISLMKKETSDPCIACHKTTPLNKPTKEKSQLNLSILSVQSDFHNRKYWFMQNDSFRRRCSFDSLELGVAIGQCFNIYSCKISIYLTLFNPAKGLAGTSHERRVKENYDFEQAKKAKGSAEFEKSKSRKMQQFEPAVEPEERTHRMSNNESKE
jgi:hypothetical protein